MDRSVTPAGFSAVCCREPYAHGAAQFACPVKTWLLFNSNYGRHTIGVHHGVTHWRIFFGFFFMRITNWRRRRTTELEIVSATSSEIMQAFLPGPTRQDTRNTPSIPSTASIRASFQVPLAKGGVQAGNCIESRRTRRFWHTPAICKLFRQLYYLGVTAAASGSSLTSTRICSGYLRQLQFMSSPRRAARPLSYQTLRNAESL